MSTCSHLIGTLLLLNVLCILPAWGWAQAATSLTLDGAKAEEAVALTLYAEAQDQAEQARHRCEQLQRQLSNPSLGEVKSVHYRQLCDDLFKATEALRYWREQFQSLSHLAATQDAQPQLHRGSSYESFMAAQRYDLEGVHLRLQELLLHADQLLQAVE